MNNKKNKKNGLGMGLSGLFSEKNISNINQTMNNINNNEDNNALYINNEIIDIDENNNINILQKEFNADSNNFHDINDQDLQKDIKNKDSIRLSQINIKLIKPCKNQPRKNFDINLLNELSESIKQNGILQPILVKDANEDGYYEIISGERRWRASIIAGLDFIPAIIKNYKNEDDVFVVSIIENLQRSDLSPVEEINAYARLYEKGYTHEEISNLVNKSRSYITNILRLDNLSLEIKDLIEEKKITIGHAKLLLNQKYEDIILSEILSKDLSVRQAEILIRKLNRQDLLKENNIKNDMINNKNQIDNDHYKKKEDYNVFYQKDQETIELENLLSSSISSSVLIEDNYIKISYKDLEDLDRLINILISERVN
jgi:ParB family chromosome partitioning protein